MTNYRVRRGGCWFLHGATSLAARARSWYAPSFRFSYLGFRCARTRQQTIIRVFRGDSWDYGAANCRAACRFNDDPVYHINDIGLRAIRRKT